jgi:HEAT repeat protein
MSAETFDSLYSAWREWAKSADKSESGWATDFGGWSELAAATAAWMLDPDADNQRLARVGEIWAASDESEELCDFAKDHIAQCLPVLQLLSRSEFATCRWQVYEAAGSAGALGEDILRRGLTDTDPYARRRAIIAIATLKPSDSRELAQLFMGDDDPYIRQASIDLVTASEDRDFKSKALGTLLKDPAQHVRDKALQAVDSTR